MSQVVEPETHPFTFLEHARPDCRWSEMVLHQHVGYSWLPSFQLEGSEDHVDRALYMAAREGLETLSIGNLAKELKMSKSGLFVHFGSKENLETAVVERAGVFFFDHVLVPIEEDGLEGIERVWTLCDLWLKFVEDRVFPGGYFFTGAYLQCAGQRGSIPRQIRDIACECVRAGDKGNHFRRFGPEPVIHQRVPRLAGMR